MRQGMGRRLKLKYETEKNSGEREGGEMKRKLGEGKRERESE